MKSRLACLLILVPSMKKQDKPSKNSNEVLLAISIIVIIIALLLTIYNSHFKAALRLESLKKSYDQVREENRQYKIRLNRNQALKRKYNQEFYQVYFIVRLILLSLYIVSIYFISLFFTGDLFDSLLKSAGLLTFAVASLGFLLIGSISAYLRFLENIKAYTENFLYSRHKDIQLEIEDDEANIHRTEQEMNRIKQEINIEESNTQDY